MSDQTMPANVIAAITRITAEIGGIAKKRGGEGGIRFPFRGIDAICSAAQPLLGANGVTIVPTESSITSIQEFTINNRPWTDTFVNVLWTIYGPGGSSDCITATTQGVGRDDSDKGYNKAMTMAFKNVLLRILCIGDPKDDADEHQDNFRDPEPTVEDLAARVFESVKGLGSERAKAFTEYVKATVLDAPKVSFVAMAEDPAWRQTVAGLLDQWLKQAPPSAVSDGVDDSTTAGTRETSGDVNVSGIVALEDTTRMRVEALPKTMKAALRDDAAAAGIKNMLMPTKKQEPWIVAWLDAYDAELDEAKAIEDELNEVATGEVNDSQA